MTVVVDRSPEVRAFTIGAEKDPVVVPFITWPVRPAPQWMGVVSIASARVMASRMAVSRRASIDLPAPGRAKEEDVGGRTPASASPKQGVLYDVPAHGTPPTPPRRARLTALYLAGPACTDTDLKPRASSGNERNFPQIFP
jgi:hypothetical protein